MDDTAVGRTADKMITILRVETDVGDGRRANVVSQRKNVAAHTTNVRETDSAVVCAEGDLKIGFFAS